MPPAIPTWPATKSSSWKSGAPCDLLKPWWSWNAVEADEFAAATGPTIRAASRQAR